MEGIDDEYFPTSVDIGNNEEKYEFHSYISDHNEQDACDSHSHMVHIYIYLESGILLSGMSTVWEDNDSCANKYMCYFFYIFNGCIIIFIWYYNGSVNKCTWPQKECFLIDLMQLKNVILKE